jgi:sucrose phosphorylase
MREVVDLLAPHVVLLTETNVPHAENISYFGDGDEAHMVYQFSLPPLLADALLSHDASALHQWLVSLDATAERTTYFNFTASHDGVGVRPLEGLLPQERRDRLVQAALARGGLIGTRRDPDGTDTPYELNVSYLDLLGEPDAPNSRRHADRFLASQAIMLSLRGIPGIYFHSLVGTPNDREGALASGINRRINRRKYQRQELDQLLAEEQSLQKTIFEAYQHMLAVRIAQPAFHPDGTQEVMDTGDHRLVVFLRSSPKCTQKVLVLANVTDQVVQVPTARWRDMRFGSDLLSGRECSGEPLQLAPYQVAWVRVM